MNTELLISSYLDGTLSHSEEQQLRTILEAKDALSAEEQVVLAMLTADAPLQPDEAWWSDEGCAAYDALQAATSSPTPATPSSEQRSARKSRRLRPLWWGVAACLVGVLAMQWWPSGEENRSETSACQTTSPTLVGSSPMEPPRAALPLATAAHAVCPPQVSPLPRSRPIPTDTGIASWPPDAKALLTDSLAVAATVADPSRRILQQCWDEWVAPMIAAMQVELDYQMFLTAHPDTLALPLYVEL